MHTHDRGVGFSLERNEEALNSHPGPGPGSDEAEDHPGRRAGVSTEEYGDPGSRLQVENRA